MSLSMRWDLSKLYSSFDSVEFENDKNELIQLISNETIWAKSELKSTDLAQQKISRILSSLEKISLLSSKMEEFIQLTLSTDATNETALVNYDKLEKIMIDFKNLDTMFIRFIGQINDLDTIIESDDQIKEFRFIISEMKEQSLHLLSEEVEPIIAKLSTTGANAFTRLREMIDGTMMVGIKVDNEDKSLPLPIVRNMAYSQDKLERKRGYEAELAAYPKVEIPLAHCLNAIKGEGNTLCELRGYDSLLDKTIKDSRITKDILDLMLEAMHDSLPKFREYFKAKALLLGHKNGLPFYDLFAPIGNSSMRFTYNEAHEFLVNTFKSFSKKMSDFVDNAFKNRWIDAESRPGKSGGAFCANLWVIGESRILSNFDGSFSQVSTLAHELGHAYHGHCLKNIPFLNTHYTMPIAETASIFNETLVSKTAFKTASDEEKFTLLDAELMEASQVIVDILSRFIFENNIIDTRKDHSMSIEEIKTAMVNAQSATYGDGLDSDYMHPYMWACKPHYYYSQLAYYNWPYAFGLLFGKGVYAEYRKTGRAFIENYDAMLAATGSNSIADVAKMMDIDITQKAFWKQSLDEIAEDIDLFCKLAKSRML